MSGNLDHASQNDFTGVVETRNGIYHTYPSYCRIGGSRSRRPVSQAIGKWIYYLCLCVFALLLNAQRSTVEKQRSDRAGTRHPAYRTWIISPAART